MGDLLRFILSLNFRFMPHTIGNQGIIIPEVGMEKLGPQSRRTPSGNIIMNQPDTYQRLLEEGRGERGSNDTMINSQNQYVSGIEYPEQN